jgi:predicted PurR-regulated permease PerM
VEKEEKLRKKIFAISFLTLIFINLVLVIYLIIPFWQPIVLALISAVVFNPINRFFRKIVINRFLSALLTLVFITATVVVPLAIIGAVLSQEVLKLIDALNNWVKTGALQVYIQEIKSKILLTLYKFQIQYPFLEKIINIQNINELVEKIIKTLSENLTSLTKGLLVFISISLFNFFVYSITLFFSLYGGDKALKHLKRLLPLEEKDKEEIFNTIYSSITAVIYGTVGTAVVQSIIVFWLYIYYDLPYPLLWAIATAFFAFIPPFGTGYIWFPVVLYELLLVDFHKGLIGLLVGFLIVSSIDNFVRPLIMGGKINLPYIFLFFSIVGGLVSFGFTGLFLGPTLFALFLTLIKLYEERIQNM